MVDRINAGCGTSPTPGWRNLDNSPAVRLRRYPWALALGSRLGLVAEASVAFARAASTIEWADVRRRIPAPDGSVDVVYSSHMVEHLTRDERDRFLAEGLRVLRPGGVLRLAVPDLQSLVDGYVASGDSDAFLEGTLLVPPAADGLRARLRRMVIGERHHRWMYNGPALCRVVAAAGFVEPAVMAPGTTRISDPGDLDLFERVEGSVYVEAFAP